MKIFTKKDWEKKASEESVIIMEDIFGKLGSIKDGYSLRYQTRSYVGIEINSKVDNFISFKPLKKDYVWIGIRLGKTPQRDSSIEVSGIKNFNHKNKRYNLKIKGFDFDIELLKNLAKEAKG